MSPRPLLPTLALLAACGPRLPSALQPTPPAPAMAEISIVEDLPGAARVLVGSDPLLRRPRASVSWETVAGGEPIAQWAQLAAHPQPQPADWWALERQWPGTLAVPLARGARLADLESILAAGLRPEDTARVAALLAPLDEPDRTGPSDILPLLAWTAPGQGPPEQAAAVLKLAERSVLLGWLDGPGLPVGPTAQALRPGIHDRLIDAPAGALLMARAAEARDPAAAADGRRYLELATTLALAGAAADRDAEQGRHVLALAAAATELREAGLEVGEERSAPLAVALAAARQGLTRDAADDASAGLALVALTAERLQRTCPDVPCRGLDRVSALRRAASWHPEAAALAATWRAIAAKEALDQLEVTVGRPTFGAGLPDLVDVLLAEGSGRVDASLLRQQAAGPVTWLAVTRALDAADATDQDTGLAALRSLVRRRCDEALAVEAAADRRELLTRIRDRAAP